MVKKNHVKHMQEKKHKDILLNIKNIEKKKLKYWIIIFSASSASQGTTVYGTI